MVILKHVFPEPILNLPKADVPLEGVTAYLVQGDHTQIVFMEFEKDVEVPPHSHESQWELVIKGTVDLNLEGIKRTYRKGDSFFIPKGAIHAATVHAGYACVAFFNEARRYKKKEANRELK